MTCGRWLLERGWGCRTHAFRLPAEKAKELGCFYESGAPWTTCWPVSSLSSPNPGLLMAALAPAPTSAVCLLPVTRGTEQKARKGKTPSDKPQPWGRAEARLESGTESLHSAACQLPTLQALPQPQAPRPPGPHAETGWRI